jgi:DNA-binding transcriptional regulator LsrR (DeoR family)
MNEELIPENIKLFLQQNIDSVAQWEGLLLLHTHPDKEWSAKEAARHLYITQEKVIQLLSPLVSRGLIEIRQNPTSSFYRFRPNSPELSEMIKLADALYRQYLIPVTHIIHTASRNKARKG